MTVGQSPSFGRIGYVHPDVDDSCHVSVAHSDEKWASDKCL